jgi:predicted RNase H-like HicB family nuclease
MRVVIKVRSEPDGGVRAWCPALPGCLVRGRSPEQVKAMMEQAIRAYLASLDACVPWRVEPQYLTV